MASLDRISATRRAAGRTSRRRLAVLGGGTDGNEQLTAAVGVILLVLFAVLGVSIVRIGQLLWLHLFLGVLLAGPVALKVMSTGYRFARYYTGDRAYRLKGPPHPLLRMLGPLVILVTAAVFLTGLLLLVDGPSAPTVLRLAHRLTFFAWLAVIGVHVLGHLGELPGALRAVSRGQGRRGPRPGATGRTIVIIGAVAAGLALALLFLPDIHAWTSSYARPLGHFGPGGAGALDSASGPPPPPLN